MLAIQLVFLCKFNNIKRDRLPKTRSGKVLRGTMKSILNKKKYNFPATIDDETTLKLIHDAVDAKGFKNNNL